MNVAIYIWNSIFVFWRKRRRRRSIRIRWRRRRFLMSSMKNKKTQMRKNYSKKIRTEHDRVWVTVFQNHLMLHERVLRNYMITLSLKRAHYVFASRNTVVQIYAPLICVFIYFPFFFFKHNYEKFTQFYWINVHTFIHKHVKKTIRLWNHWNWSKFVQFSNK